MTHSAREGNATQRAQARAALAVALCKGRSLCRASCRVSCGAGRPREGCALATGQTANSARRRGQRGAFWRRPKLAPARPVRAAELLIAQHVQEEEECRETAVECIETGRRSSCRRIARFHGPAEGSRAQGPEEGPGGNRKGPLPGVEKGGASGGPVEQDEQTERWCLGTGWLRQGLFARAEVARGIRTRMRSTCQRSCRTGT